MIAIAIIKAVVSWLVLAFIGKNMIGMVVRGFFTKPEMERLAHDGHDFTKQEVKKYHRKNRIITSTSIILLVVFFYLLLRYLHPVFAIAAAMIMIGRIPDLVWEVQHWQELPSSALDLRGWLQSRKNLPQGAIYTIMGLLLWGTLLVLFWAFYTL